MYFIYKINNNMIVYKDTNRRMEYTKFSDRIGRVAGGSNLHPSFRDTRRKKLPVLLLAKFDLGFCDEKKKGFKP